MNESFELLSSMSPKLKGGQKTVKKAIKILALKKHFRRSSIYDKVPAVNNEDLALVEIGSINSENNVNENTKDIDKIIIDSTDSDDFPTSEPKKLSSEVLKNCDKEIYRIQEWLDNIESCDKKDSLTFFSQVSTIYGEETTKGGDGVAACSTFNEYITQRFDELFVTSKHDLKHKHMDDLISNDSFSIEPNTSLRSKLEKKSGDECKNISTNKNTNLFDKNSDGSVNFRNAITDFKDSNEAKLVIDDTLLTSDESISKASNTFKTPKDRTPERALSNQVNHVTIRKTNTKIVREPQTTDLASDISMEMETMLDSLYGVQWRSKQNHVLPLSEPKKKPLKVNGKTNCTPITARIFEPFDTKKLSKLHPAPKKINFNKLQTPIASPWRDRLKGLVDSDSETDVSDTKEKSRGIENLKTRLRFSEVDPVIKIDDDKKNPKSKIDYPKKRAKENHPNEIRVNAKNRALQNENKVNPLLENGNKKSTVEGVNNKKVLKTNTFKEKSSSSSSCSEIEISSDEEYDNEITKMYEIKRKSMRPFKEERYSFLESLSGYVPLSKCDMTARIFRTNFKHYRDELKSKLFSIYNEKIFDNAIPNDTQLEWNDKLRNTAGLCYCKKITHRDGKVIRKVKIALSSKVLDSPDRLRDTLIHEMCHAGTWIVNQISNGHGVYWKNWAFKAMKVFPELPPIKRCHSYQIKTKYTYKCTGCGYSFGRHSKSLDTERKRCGHCYGKFELLINKTYKTGETRAVPVTPRKQATPFSLFVKENYALYKEPTRKHGDVMKILGQKFSELKVKNIV